MATRGNGTKVKAPAPKATPRGTPRGKAPAGLGGKVVNTPVGKDQRGWSLLSGMWPTRWNGTGELFSEPTVLDMEGAYRHPIIRACVDEIATSCGEPEWEVGAMVGGEWQPLDDHPVLDLLREPNTQMGRAGFLRAIVSRYLLTGLGYVLSLERIDRQGVAEMWPIPTSWVTPVKGTGTTLDRGYRVHGQARIIAPEEMLVWRHFDPSSIAGVCPPYMAAFRDHALDQERENYLAEMLLNLKVPGLTIINKAGFQSNDERREAKRDIRNAIGRGNRGEPLLLEGEVDVKMEAPLADLDWPNMAGGFEARLCMAFGVPPIIIGARIGLARSTFANYAEARKGFYTETMRPLWVELGDVLTRGLLWPMDDDKELQLRARYHDLPEFQEDATAKTTRVVQKRDAGIITLGEARDELGYGPDIPPELQEEIDAAAQAAQAAREAAPPTKPEKE